MRGMPGHHPSSPARRTSSRSRATKAPPPTGRDGVRPVPGSTGRIRRQVTLEEAPNNATERRRPGSRPHLHKRACRCGWSQSRAAGSGLTALRSRPRRCHPRVLGRAIADAPIRALERGVEAAGQAGNVCGTGHAFSDAALQQPARPDRCVPEKFGRQATGSNWPIDSGRQTSAGM